jgi:hypothetical protein
LRSKQGQRAKCPYLELILDLGKLFGEYLRFTHTGIYLLFQNLGPSLENLDVLGLTLVADTVTLVVRHDALGANVDVVVLAKVLSLFVRVLGTELFLRVFLVLLLLLLGRDVLLRV